MVRFWLQTGAVTAVVATILYYVLQVKVISLPILIGIILSNILESFCIRLEGRGYERGKAVMIVFASFMAIAAGFLVLIGEALAGQLGSFADRVPLAASRVDNLVRSLQNLASSGLPFQVTVDVRGEIANAFAGMQASVLPEIPSIAVSLVIGILTVPIVTFFLLRDGRALKKTVLEAVPNRYFEMVTMIMWKVSRSISAYIRGVALEASLVGTVDLILISLAGLVTGIEIENIILIAAVAAMTNIIPFAGPAIGTILGVGITLFGADPSAMLVVAICLVIGQLLDNVVFAPLVLGGAVSVHPITVIVLLVLGGKIMGVLGMLVIVPLFAVTTVILHELYLGVRRHAMYLQ